MHIKAFFEINHEGGAIHSIDFHPSGTRVVTAGCTGDSGGSIIVWDVSGLYNGNHDIVELCTVPFIKPVNCARYSVDGNQIAVADDSHSITLLKLQKKTRTHDGKPRENYRATHNIVGHSADVLEVRYSVNGSMLATTSVDCSAKIWSVEQFPRCLTVLKEENGGHKDSVKGCAWDPIGRYFATHGADKAVKIWKTDSWECVFTLSEPFKDSSYNVLFNRMDWTPDGVALIIPGATNNTFPTAHILVRGEWTYAKDFVGHEKNLAVASVCGEMRILEDKRSKKKFFGYIAALGGADRSLSVWSFPRARRPIVVIHNIVDQPILDMKWFGRCLALCSLDGTVRFMTFKESEIGQALTKSQFKQHCFKKYGFTPTGLFSNDATEKESEDMDVCDYWDKKISSIPGELKFEWREDGAVQRAPKKMKMDKPAVLEAEKKEEPMQAVQLVFKTKKKMKLETCQVDAEEVEEEPSSEKEKVVQLQVEPADEETNQTVNESFTGFTEIQDKFVYEFVPKNDFAIDSESEFSILSTSFNKHGELTPKPFYILNPLDDGRRVADNIVTIINDKVLGGGHSVARIQNLNPDVNAEIEGHVLACDISRHYLVVLTTNKCVFVVDRSTGKKEQIFKFRETPVGFQVLNNYCFVLLNDSLFHFLNISDNNLPRGLICTCSVKAFGTFENIQLYAVNGTPLILTEKDRQMYAASSKMRLWHPLLKVGHDFKTTDSGEPTSIFKQCLDAHNKTVAWRNMTR